LNPTKRTDLTTWEIFTVPTMSDMNRGPVSILPQSKSFANAHLKDENQVLVFGGVRNFQWISENKK
jgi:hypothetical protein